ncbi:hypothetical protein CTEN210_14881 [Chaetoceros tenuissimus]|uniref:HSF-type DNA-binding domain-containing protein n=1 Tax=Chaetoceros tenuissimus TaxID=426638 RepID=A0AAD3D8F2_9STRA|nr:hypothetical protein CTEN210_14881 [Chaetoceros tenuissimus]
MSFFQNNFNDAMPTGGNMSLWNAAISNEDRTQWLQHFAHQNQQEQKVSATQDQNSANSLLYSSIQPSLSQFQPEGADAQIDVAKNEEKKEPLTREYRDYANCNERIEICTKGGVKVPFPVVLYNMLEHIDLKEPQLAKIISWQPHGRCFVTHNPKRFEDEVLPRFFKQKHYASFRRQLNLWGFKRLTQSGPDNGAYYHEMFLRTKTYLCRAIERLANGSGNGRGPSNPEGEPHFFSMEPLPPSSTKSHENDVMPCTEHMLKNRPLKRESFDSNSEHLTVISSASVHNVSSSPSADSIHSSKPASNIKLEDNPASASTTNANQMLMNLSKLQSQIQQAEARLMGEELLQGVSANQLSDILLHSNSQARNQCIPLNFDPTSHQGPYFNSNQQAHSQPNALQNLHAIQNHLLSESPGTSLRNIFETNANNALNPFDNSNLSRRSLLDEGDSRAFGSFNDSIEISNLAPINEQEMKAINVQDKSKIFDV